MVKIICENCGKEVEKVSTEVKRNKTHFCSRECYFDSKRKKKPTTRCQFCNTEFIIRPAQLKKYKNHYCSTECKKKQWEKNKDLTGKKCGRCVVTQLDDDDAFEGERWLLKCQCGEVFSRRTQDIKNNRVYECPNCLFRRSQYYIGGKKYGRLSVQDDWEWRVSPTNGKRFRHWRCICECGKESWISGQAIIRGHTTSCGCYMQKNNSRYANPTLYPTRHGMSGKFREATYGRWIVLLSKCYNQKYQQYKYWGGSGYTVCDLWRNDYHAFHDWCMEKGFEKELCIDIKEGCKEFSSKNCFLVPIKDYLEKKRKKRYLERYGVEYQGKVKVLREWAKEFGISYQTLVKRYRICKDLDKCLSGKWKDGSGCYMKRDDIPDEKVLELYKLGHTCSEIDAMLGASVAYYRLQQMGVIMREQKFRSSEQRAKRIHELLREKKTLEEIDKEKIYANRGNLVRKLHTMKVKIADGEIDYG